jgi:hypothetical protein
MSHRALRSRPGLRSLGRHNARRQGIDVDLRFSPLEIKRAIEVRYRASKAVIGFTAIESFLIALP